MSEGPPCSSISSKRFFIIRPGTTISDKEPIKDNRKTAAWVVYDSALNTPSPLFPVNSRGDDRG